MPTPNDPRIDGSLALTLSVAPTHSPLSNITCLLLRKIPQQAIAWILFPRMPVSVYGRWLQTRNKRKAQVLASGNTDRGNWHVPDSLAFAGFLPTLGGIDRQLVCFNPSCPGFSAPGTENLFSMRPTAGSVTSVLTSPEFSPDSRGCTASARMYLLRRLVATARRIVSWWREMRDTRNS